MKPCWLLQSEDVCFVHLGKFGDIMIMLPAFKAVADELGKPVVCIVSTAYSSIFDGVSYVEPLPVGLHWWKGVGQARKMAESWGLKPIVVKWWDEPGAKPPGPAQPGRTITLKIHGHMRTVDASEWDSFQASQWRYAGFTMEQFAAWPMVFDQRDPHRESVLRSRCFSGNRPKLLVNLSKSGTSPFPHAAQVMALVAGKGFDIVHLDRIKAYRIYDLLGLYDHAAMLVTSDTATLHLAGASNVPYIAFINNGGAGSIPKGNCVLSIRYGDFHQQIGRFVETLKSFHA